MKFSIFNFQFSKLFFIFILLVISYWSLVINVRAQDCGSDLDCQITQIQREIDALSPAQEHNKQELASLKKQLDSLNKRIAGLSSQLKNIQSEIVSREEDLEFAKKIFEQKTNSHYKFIRLYDPLSPFLFASDAIQAFREINFRQKAADEDRKTMEKYAADLLKLKSDKETLEKNKASLASAQKQVDEKAKFLEGEVNKVEAYLSSLTAKQQELIALKSGNFSVSVGDAALADDYNASLTGWQANAPPGSVTTFSFGAYAGNGTNYRRNGMSQYGAWARAKSGQDYNAILQAYYGATPVKKDMPATINTTVGTMPFEKQYLYGIAEMPSAWAENNSAALKAQAIAARTFAYRYIQSGSTICVTDKCQVYDSSKVGRPDAQPWRDAVDATQGLVLPDGVSAQYVSTPGGYLDTKGWDTTCGSQGCLVGGAWDAASPWFYKAWYTKYEYRVGFTKCKRDNPWLSQGDMTDILNAWRVYTNGTDDDRSHVLPPDGCGGGSPYSLDQMRSRADALGGAYTTVYSVKVYQNNSGYTSQMNFKTDKGDVGFTGFDTECSHKGFCNDFFTIFNLRAPGFISIKSRMFDVRIK